MAAHSRFAPSAAERWVYCPASIGLSEQFPKLIEEPSAPEGVAAHWVAQQLIETGEIIAADTPAPNGVLVTEEMVEGAALYRRVVEGLGVPFDDVWVEEREYMPAIHPDAFGTPDASTVVGDWLHIIDYKFGHGEVDPFENWQLAMYANGILHREERRIERVVFAVVQPRCYSKFGPVRSWETTPAYLAQQMWPRLNEAAHAVNPQPVVGRHCLHCPARRACPALRRTAQYWGDYANASIAHELDATSLGIELRHAERALEMMAARVEAYREQAEVLARSGQRVPHYALEPGRGVTEWTVPASKVLALGTLVGADLAKPAAPITPTQARKKFGKLGIDDSVISLYSQRTAGKLKLQLIPDSTDARIFSHVSE